MVSDTRSGRKIRDEADGHSLKNKINMTKDSSIRSPGKADTSGVRRSAKETSLSRETTPSPQSTRKSKRLEKEMPPLTPPMKRKSERLEKYSTPSPLRKSDRGKKNLSSSSSGSRQCAKELSLSELKRKKEKSLIQVTMESEKAELGMKRKRMNARTFVAPFKKQYKKIVSDEGELERPDKLSHISSDNGQESLDDSGRLPRNCSSTGNMDALESESSTSLTKVLSLSSESGDKHMHPKETTPSPSAKCESCSLLGTCVLCSKNKRVIYDSPDQELCSCDPIENKDPGRLSTCKDRDDYGAGATLESAENGDCRNLQKEDGHENVCAVCNKDGELLFCVGKGCKRFYHLCCLDPPLTDFLPGVWHCPQCVKKKLLFSVHSVSEGVESIWDVRQVELSNAKGVRQRQYLVKYHGLAHIHNLWVPEKQLLLENPSLVSNFSAKDQQIVRWSAEWTVPHRLLRRRPIQDKIYVASTAVISVCNYEWLVKWQGLSYDHATWELDSANFLSSSLGQNLMKGYIIRREKAKKEVNKHEKGSIAKLSELPGGQSPVNGNCILENVNRLHECWFKCQNAIVFDNQERATTVVSFIQSVIKNSGPFLIVASSSLLSQWEAEFARLVPSLDVVVYSGNRDTRNGIRASEFHAEEGHAMLQVLLSSPEAVFEDIDILRTIKWEAIVIDEYQNSEISNDLEQIKTLTTNSRILLVSAQIKDTTCEYHKILSLLDSHVDLDILRGYETSDNFGKFKDRLSRFISCGSTSQASKFLEYWVPVQISNYQLEQYCSTLLSNSILLGSCSRNDPVGALRETLSSVRKCCDHPYLLDSSVQACLIAELRPAAEILDIGIKASGKLQLLDKMLTEIKTRGLQVLVLYQLIIGSGGTSTGDILDDFLRQRFGQNTYERVDAGVIPPKKQAAANRFNKKESGQFVFLLENRACSSAIKLTSMDVIIIYDSDWNPAIDLRQLQKISIDSKVEQVKVFRLYSSCTVEERALVLAKKNLNLENNVQTLKRATSDSLLSWGASYLFRKLDEYHADSNSASAFDFSSGELLLNQVTKEFQATLSECCENTDLSSVISKVKLGVGSYSANIPMLGEAEVQLKDVEEPHVFWKNLLDRKSPQWKHLREPSPRNRKRVHYFDGSSSNENHDMVKKRKKVVNENADEVELGVRQVTRVACSNQAPSVVQACNQSQSLRRDDITSKNNPNFSVEASARASEERIVSSSEEQKSLQSVLHGEMTRLCQILQLSEDVTRIVRNFLEYVIKNHQVNSDSPAIVQAFQISLCWIAGSISKKKVDKKDSLMLAKQLLNYECTEEQAVSVYSKMRSLKRMYCVSAKEDINKERSNINKDGSQFSTGGNSLNAEKLGLKDQADESEIDSNKIKKIQKRSSKRMKKLIRRQQEEIEEFHKVRVEKWEKLRIDHKLETAVIQSLYGQGSVLRMDKLKVLDDNFAKKMESHNNLNDMKLKELEAEQLAAMNEERERAYQLLAEAKAQSSEPHSLSCQSEGNAGIFQSRIHNDDVSPSITSVSVPAEALVCITPAETPSNNEENVSVNQPASVELVSDETRSVLPNKEFQVEVPETIPIEDVGHVEISNKSDRDFDKENLPNASVNQRDGPDEEASGGCIPSPGQPLVSPPTVALPDCCDLSPQQVPQDEIHQFMVSAEAQDPDAPAVENQTTSQIEVSTSEPVGNVNPKLSNLEATVTDDTVTPVQSDHEAPVTENTEQLQLMSADASRSCNPSPAIQLELQNHDQGISSSQTADPRGTEVLSHESISQNEDNLELYQNHLVSGPISRVAPQNNVAIPQLVLGTARLPNQAVVQPGVDGGHLHGPNYFPAHPTHQATSWSSTPSLFPDPLHTELERILKDTDQLEKSHKDRMSQVKSDCEKEIQEIIAQIRKKYELKLQDTEAEFRLKRNELDKNQRNVRMNKILADAFRSKCLDLRPSGLPGFQQGVQSGFMQQLYQLPQPPPMRLPPPALPQQNSSPAVQSVQQQQQQLSQSHSARLLGTPSVPQQNPRPAVHTMLQQHSMRSSSSSLMAVANQSSSVAAPPVQAVRDAAALFSSSRPLLIGSITPAAPTPTRVAGEIRSRAPHLQSMRPPSSSIHSAMSPPGFQFRPRPPSTPNPTPSQVELVMEMDRRAFVPENHASSPLPDICSNFRSLELADLETLGSVQGNQTSSAIASDVVCLSDDD